MDGEGPKTSNFLPTDMMVSTNPASIQVTDSPSGPSFHLSTSTLSYRFHVSTGAPVAEGAPIPVGELVHDHFGSPVTEDVESNDILIAPNQVKLGRIQRELADLGRGDYRLPSIHIRYPEGHTVSHFVYKDHEVIPGKPKLEGLPATWGSESEVTTLQVRMVEERSGLEAVLSYSVFKDSGAIARSVRLENKGKGEVEIQRLASWGGDLEVGDWEMIQLCGDWGHEAKEVRRKVYTGTQGFQTAGGYSSHHHNPFVALVHPSTTETSGPAYGYSLIYSGSFACEVEKSPQGQTRVLLGLNPLQLSWPLKPGESFTTPECVAVYSEHGIGGLSRNLHRLYRNNLSTSKYTHEPRPALLNNWEATYFDITADKLFPIASKAADLGAKLFVLDDGWFGRGNHARTNDHKGLGDWFPNEEIFPEGLGAFVDKVTGLKGGKMKFGIWVEPEMVNPKSDLYATHPDWVLHATDHERTLERYQLVLDLSLTEVQDYIIHSLTKILSSANISYVKWDKNRMIHETSSPSTIHRYTLGIYRVFETLTTRFPDVLWEGCASGGGRFDAGLLHYFPQTWTSDNMDAHDRLSIQFGTTLAYPASAMGCHVCAVPNHITGRVIPFEFRAHVAMMGGSFGFELDPNILSEEEQRTIPELIKLGEKVNPLVINGEMYRLNLPLESNFPAAMYVAQNGQEAVLLAYQVRHVVREGTPALRLQGLEEGGKYEVDMQGQKKVYSGATLMGTGLKIWWKGDFQSRVVFISKK